MIRIVRSRITLAVGFAGFLLATPAMADFDVHSVSIPAQMTTDFKLSLALPAFDSKLGTLKDVILSYSDSANVQGTVINTSASAQTFTVSESVAFSLAYGGASMMGNTLVASQTFTKLGIGSTGQFGPQNPTGSTSPLILTDGALYNAFANPGAGPSFLFSTLTTTTVAGGGGNVTTGIYTKADATLTVIFDYELKPNITPAVPEPASLLMTALGGLAVASARLVRRRARALSGR